MTFEQFKKAVENYRNDIIISKHGEFCNNSSKNTLGVIFIKNGKKSKVYNYSGTYSEILTKLNIPHATRDRIDTVKQTLAKLMEEHGEEDFFGEVIDNTEEINRYKEELSNLLSAPLVD